MSFYDHLIIRCQKNNNNKYSFWKLEPTNRVTEKVQQIYDLNEN